MFFFEHNGTRESCRQSFLRERCKYIIIILLTTTLPITLFGNLDPPKRRLPRRLPITLVADKTALYQSFSL